MFGLGKKNSKKDDAAGKPSKVTRSDKSSGPKFDFVQFLLQHGEKIVIGLVVLAASYFLWSGWNTQTIDEAKNIGDLTQQATAVKNKVDEENHWGSISESRKYDVNFRHQSELSRIPTDAGPYRPDVWENVNRTRGGKRGDPVILAPLNLKAHSFMGAIAVKSSRPAIVEELPGADPVDAKKVRRKPDDPEPADRLVPSGVDFGYEVKDTKLETDSTGRVKSDSTMSVPLFTAFAAVTAAVPHKLLVENYNAEFENAPDYNPDRDSPNYRGFEVQRADISNVSDITKLTDKDWKSLPATSGDAYEKLVDKWPGTCKETAVETYTVEKLTMEIPPILLSSYNEIVDHPKIPQTAKKTANAGGMEGGGYMGGGPVATNYGAGYGGGASYGGGPGGPSGPGGPAGGQTQIEEVDPEDVSKAETLTDYKLLRFFDFAVQPGHTYIYRTRLIVEDPNYPRSKTVQPKVSTMKDATVKRVQDLIDADKPLLAADKKAKRTSRIFGEWSAASESVTIPSQSRIFASTVKRDSMGVATASAVYGEWDKALATLVPIWEQTVKVGQVFGGSMGKTAELDVIAPVSKKIKKVPNYLFSNAVTVADVAGGEMLDASPPRHDLRKGGEIIAFDSGSGELIVAREFDDYSNFRLYSYAPEREKAEKEKKEKDKN